jgi:hypothetical protein
VNLEAVLAALASGLEIQTLIFSKEKFPTAEKAIEFAKSHGFRADKVDENENSFRLRQIDPEDLQSDSMRTIEITDGVQAVVGKRKGASQSDPNASGDTNTSSADPNASGKPVGVPDTSQSSGSGSESRTEPITEVLKLSLDLVSAVNSASRKWLVTIMQAGESLDRIHYFPPEILKVAVADGKFENVRVFQFCFNGSTNHLPEEVEQPAMLTGLFKNLCGVITDTYFDDASQSVKGTLTLLSDEVHRKISALMSLGGNHAGLSIVAACDKIPMILSTGRAGKKVVGFQKVHEVDIVSFPAAGGQFERLVASYDPMAVPERHDDTTTLQTNLSSGGSNMKFKLARVLQAIGKIAPAFTLPAEETLQSVDSVLSLIDSIKVMDVKQADKMALLKELRDQIASSVTRDEAVAAVDATIAKMMDEETNSQSVVPSKAPVTTPAAALATDANVTAQSQKTLDAANAALKKAEEVQQSVAVERCNSHLETRLAQALPGIGDKGVSALRKRFSGKVYAANELEESIVEMADIRGCKIESGAVVQSMGEDLRDKLQMGLDLLVGYVPEDGEKSKYAQAHRFKSLKQSYEALTGDEDVSGGRWNPARIETSVRQALLSTGAGGFPLMLGNSMTKRMAQDYARRTADWRKLVRVKPISDFKTQEVIQWGGFTTLPEVTETGVASTYQELASPSEFRATYEPKTYGGLVAITRRTLKNDDLGFVQSAPEKLSAAAVRQLWQFVTNLLESYTAAVNDTNIYDATVLYTVGHGNLVGATLTYDNLTSARVKMRVQTEPDSGEKLNLAPKFLVVPAELEPLAWSLINSQWKPGATNEESNIHFHRYEIIENPYLHDTDNAFLIADPSTVETIEVGFIDGKEDPELILQNGDSEGNMFLKDQITYKARHEYGGTVADFRGLVGMIAP